MKKSIASFAIAVCSMVFAAAIIWHHHAAAAEHPRTIAVKPVTSAELQDIIRHRNGKVLVLNVWATWCLPCIEEFPDLVKISSTYDASKVEVIGVSIDYADEVKTKVRPFLKKHRVLFPIYLAQFASQERFIDSIEKSWNGAIPATFIYDRSGNQKFSLIGGQTFVSFQSRIDSALASGR